MTVRTCPNCSKKNFTNNPHCSHCGEVLPATPIPLKPPSPKSPMPKPPPTPPSPHAGTKSRASSSPFPSAPHLPAHISQWGTPSVTGDITDTRETEMDEKRNFAGSVLRFMLIAVTFPFRPFFVLGFIFFGNKTPPKKQKVHLVRIQQASGSIMQARIERDIYGAPLTRGDAVTLWGHESNGVLIVSKGYNHTVGAELKLGAKYQPTVNWVILAMILFLMISCVIWVATL